MNCEWYENSWDVETQRFHSNTKQKISFCKVLLKIESSFNSLENKVLAKFCNSTGCNFIKPSFTVKPCKPVRIKKNESANIFKNIIHHFHVLKLIFQLIQLAFSRFLFYFRPYDDTRNKHTQIFHVWNHSFDEAYRSMIENIILKSQTSFRDLCRQWEKQIMLWQG